MRCRSERTALEAFKFSGWTLEGALEAYFNHCALALSVSLPLPLPLALPRSVCACVCVCVRVRARACVCVSAYSRRFPAAGAFGGPQVDTAKIEAFFGAYKDEGADVVRRSGVGRERERERERERRERLSAPPAA